MSEKTELAAVPTKETALQVFQAPNGLEPYLQKIRDEIDAFVPDVTTRKGRYAIASIAYKVARSKTALDNVGKELVAELKEIPKKIDAERKRMRDKLDAWQAEVRGPLTEWEEAEKARVARHEQGVAAIKAEGVELGLLATDDLLARIGRVEAVVLGDTWEEFAAEAGQVKDQVLAALREALVARQKYDADQAELARLQREAEERAEQDRIRLAQEAAVEAERQRVAQQQQAERDAAARREQELINQAAAQRRALEQAEANRIAAEHRAEQERQDAARRAEEAAEQARQEERRRADAAAAEIVRQQEARERDKNHRRNINRAALDAFIAGGMTEECAKQAITLIAERKIPNIQISY